MFEGRKRVLMAAVLAFAMFLSAIVIVSDNGEEVQAKKTYGDTYYYIDNTDPEPKVSYDWLDVKGAAGSTDMSMFSYNDHYNIELTWEFPFYSGSYDDLHISARGYICFDSWDYSSGYSGGIPQSSSPNPMIAAGWSSGYGNAYYMEGSTNNVNWVAIEWTSNSHGLHFEAILYESGMIKLQYDSAGTSSYTNGASTTIGIEDQTGNTGIAYSDYSDSNVPDKTVVVFSNSESISEQPVVENADPYELTDGSSHPVCYADYRSYKITFNITTTTGASDLLDVRLYFGPPSLGIFAQYDPSGGGSIWRLGGGPSGPGNGSIDIDVPRSIADTNRFGDPWGMVVYVTFSFDFPWEGELPMTVWASGKASLPNSQTYEDVVYLDTGVRLMGDFQVMGEDGRHLEDDSFTADNETVHFTGVKLLYNKVNLDNPNATIHYPKNESYHFVVVDEELNEYNDFNVSGRNFSVFINMPLDPVEKEFHVDIPEIPSERINGELLEIALRVDDSTPAAPSSFVIRADSFKDKQKEVDNDDILYISWGSVTDSGSGVRGYKISSEPDPNNESAIEVDPRVTQYVWNSTAPGDFKLYVWAVDNVGHTGEMADQSIQIDKDDPFFTDVGWDTDSWITTLTPTLTITARDGYTISEDISGVRRSTAEYSISTEGVDGFEDWISVGLFDEEVTRAIGDDDVEISVQPRFIEGTENYIKFRIKDWAGNGYAESDIFNVKIDVTDVSFEQFFPTQDAWHNIDVINEKEISVYLDDQTSGVMARDIYYRISHEIDENGNYIWDTGVQPDGGWVEVSSNWYDKMDGNNRVWVHFPYGDFIEGELNFVQFTAKDYARNGDFTPKFSEGSWSRSPLFQVLVNTKPVAIISSPQHLSQYNLTELITLDASESYDIDVDAGNLKYEWKEGNETLGTDMRIENFRFDTLGWHTITLYVGDSGHKEGERAMAEVMVNITKFIPSKDEDTDGDGMDDLWEWENLLDLNDKSDRDQDPDSDGYTNYEEYLGTDGVGPYKRDRDGNDPWDSSNKPDFKPVESEEPVIESPFGIWIFILVIVAAIVVGALIILIGYLRIHRQEDSEKREEAEEEAMLATPQLDIPQMPANIPQVDTSVPTLPTPEGDEGDQAAALPPAQQMDAQPMEQGQQQPQPQPMEQPQPDQAGYQPQQEDPMYQDPNQSQQNPLYEGQQ